MSLSDGQSVNATVTNTAFMSRTTDTTTTGKVDLNNTGSTVQADIQLLLNQILDTSGIAGLNDATRKIYSSLIHISSGDDRKIAIGKLDAALNAHELLTSNPHSVNIDQVTPTTTKGDIIVHNATNAVRVPVGTDNQILEADSADAEGVNWVDKDTFEDLSPLTTKGDLVAFSTTDIRLPVGTNTQVLTADSAEASGVKWAAASGGASSSQEPDLIENITMASGVAASALTVRLKTLAGADAGVSDLIRIAFRDPTIGTGTGTILELDAAESMVVPSGATLGHTDGKAHPIYVYAVNDAGSITIGVSTTLLDETKLQSSTTVSAGSDNDLLLYQTSSVANRPVRLIARGISNQATAGTWALALDEQTPAVPSVILPFKQVIAFQAEGSSQVIATATGVTVIFGTENFDKSNSYNTGTGVFTVPTDGAGIYICSAHIRWSPASGWAAGEIHLLKIMIGGVVFAQSQYEIPSSDAGTTLVVEQINTVLDLVDGDTVEIEVVQSSGSSQTLTAGDHTFFAMARI